MSVVEAKVAHDTDVVRASVGFEKIVVRITNVVIVEVDIGMRPPVLSRFRRAGCLIDANSIPEILKTVVTHSVALPCHRDRIEGASGAAYSQGRAGQIFKRNNVTANIPPQYLWIESADEHVISDVKVF
jgi:hypothetical protein